MTSPGDVTRQRLLDSALGLWAQYSPGSVSLNDITRHAQQRNASALQYHFGSRAGLLDALFERHVPALRARREELVEIARERPGDARAAAEALVLPTGELVAGDWRDRAFARVAANLFTAGDRADLIHLISESAAEEAFDLLLERLDASIPRAVRTLRVRAAGLMAMHTVADYVHYLEQHDNGPARDVELFLTNLIDMYVAIVAAPVSEATLRASRKRRTKLSGVSR